MIVCKVYAYMKSPMTTDKCNLQPAQHLAIYCCNANLAQITLIIDGDRTWQEVVDKSQCERLPGNQNAIDSVRAQQKVHASVHVPSAASSQRTSEFCTGRQVRFASMTTMYMLFFTSETLVMRKSCGLMSTIFTPMLVDQLPAVLDMLTVHV